MTDPAPFLVAICEPDASQSSFEADSLERARADAEEVVKLVTDVRFTQVQRLKEGRDDDYEVVETVMRRRRRSAEQGLGL